MVVVMMVVVVMIMMIMMMMMMMMMLMMPTSDGSNLCGSDGMMAGRRMAELPMDPMLSKVS